MLIQMEESLQNIVGPSPYSQKNGSKSVTEAVPFQGEIIYTI